jgi:hypothetical protein
MFNEQVNVIRHNVKRVNGESKFFSLLIKKLFESLFDSMNKNFSPIFRTPDDVPFQAENGPGIFHVSWFHYQSYTSDEQIMSANSLLKEGRLSAVA